MRQEGARAAGPPDRIRKVALIGPVYPFRAGIAYCTTRLAEELAKRFEVRLISFKRQYPASLYPGGNDIDATLRDRVPSNARFLLDILNPLTWIRTARGLRRERVDAIVLVWWIWVWAIPYLVIRWFARVPVIVQCHNVSDKEPAWWKRALTNRVLSRADRIVVHSASDEQEARRRLGDHAPVVRSFLPVHEMGGQTPSREQARARLKIPPGPTALFFGHIRPFKGLDILLEAWRQLKTRATLIVAGEVWFDDEKRYRELIDRLDLRDKVIFEPRFIPDSEIGDYFAAADVVVAPYRREAQSGVAMTAFHFGRPVIATRVGGLPEIITDGGNGLLVPPEDSQQLAAALDRFFAHADRQVMERAAAVTARRLSWHRYGEEFGTVLQNEAWP